MSELKKEWFEPGPDGESPFVRKYNASPGTAGEAIAAAFRALIAQDEEANIRDAELFEQQVLNDEPPALQVGDVVRLEEFRQELTNSTARLSCKEVVGKEAEVTFIRKDSVTVRVPGHWCSNVWSPDALTLIRRAGEAAPVANDAEIARLRAEVERLKSECSDQQRYVLDLESTIARKETRIKVLEVANDSLTQYSSNLTAERDALQAQRDAGVREVCKILEATHE